MRGLRICTGDPSFSVQAAINDLLTTENPNNLHQCAVVVLPGNIVGDITIPPYVSVCGVDNQGSVIVGNVTLGPASTLANVKVQGKVTAECHQDGAWNVNNVVIVNYDATNGVALDIVAKAGATSGVGGYVWGSVFGSFGPYGVRINSNLGTIEYLFRDTNIEMYGANAVAAMYARTGSLHTRSKNCTYQMNHSGAPNSVGIDVDGLNFRSYGDSFESNDETKKFVKVLNGNVKLFVPQNFVAATNGQTGSGGSITVDVPS